MPLLPPETFRIRPYATEPDYFVVHLAPSIDALRQTMAACGMEPEPGQVAVCIKATSQDPEHAHLIGIVILPLLKHGLTSLVAHEIAHAAFRVMDDESERVHHWERVQTAAGETTDPGEETYCGIVEHLTSDFWTQFYEGGHDGATG